MHVICITFFGKGLFILPPLNTQKGQSACQSPFLLLVSFICVDVEEIL